MGDHTEVKYKRPFLIYLLAVIFLGAALVALLSTIGILREWNWYLAYSGSPSPAYTVFRGVFLFPAWLTAAAFLWKGYRWSVSYAGTLTVINLLWFWVDRLFLTQNPLSFNRHIISIVVTCLFSIMVLLSLYLLNPLLSRRSTTGEK